MREWAHALSTAVSNAVLLDSSAQETALRDAIARHRADAEGLLEGIETGAVMADDEGFTRAKIEADVWDKVAALTSPEATPARVREGE